MFGSSSVPSFLRVHSSIFESGVRSMSRVQHHAPFVVVDDTKIPAMLSLMNCIVLRLKDSFHARAFNGELVASLISLYLLDPTKN